MSANEHMVTELGCALLDACGLLRVAKCPNEHCIDGGIPVQTSDRPDFELEQCQWCAERTKIIEEHG